MNYVFTLFLFIMSVYFDLRFRRIPLSLLSMVMVISLVVGIRNGQLVPILFFTILIPISDIPKRFIRVLIVSGLTVGAVLLQPTLWTMILSILGLWFLWEFGAMGGADMKLMASTIFIANTPFVLLPMFLIGGIQGLIALFQKKKEIPFVVSIFFGFLFYTFTSTM